MTNRRSVLGLLAVAVSPLLACGGGSTAPSTPIASKVIKVQGDGQVGQVGLTLPQNPVVEVQDATGNPMAGATVRFSVTSGAGTVTPGTTTTDVNGRASALWTLGTSSSLAHRLTATSGSATTTFSAQAAPGPAVTIQASSGDNQTAAPGSTLPAPLTVQLQDQYGNGVPGVTVTFSAAAGTVSPQQATTDQNGSARTTATVGTVSELGGQASILPDSLSRPRKTLSYVQQLEAARTTTFSASAPGVGSVTFTARAGAASNTTWSLSSGSLPPGLTLTPDGVISGMPTTLGQYQFTVMADESGGSSVTRSYSLLVCDAPVSLAPGESLASDPPASGQCGIFLPSGAPGDRYRVTVSWPSSAETPDDAPVTLRIHGDGVSATAAPPAAVTVGGSGFVVPSAMMEEGIQRDEATAQVHAQLLENAKQMFQRLGSRGLLPSRNVGAARVAPADAPDQVTFDAPSESCTPASAIQAVKLYENNDVVFYQDVAQRSTTPVDSTLVRQMADFYSAYGKRVINGYFGGIPDVDGNGKFIVLITPLPSFASDALAFVLERDLRSTDVCAGSNQAEMTYFSASGINAMSAGANQNFQAMAALVHEVKHISSLYNRLQAADLDSRPTWIEEGTADIAGEVASRFAWAATGGPAPGVQVTRNSFRAVTAENFGILVRLSRVVVTLSSQPNALTTNPTDAPPSHTFYGSSWHFHRFLGDAFYGGIPNDSTFFRDQNSVSADPGVGFYQNELGKSYQELLQDEAVAMMVNGQSAAPNASWDFVSYDFPSAAESFCSPNPLGAYPWPLTTTGTRVQGNCASGYDPKQETFDPSAPFTSDTFQGPIGRGGFRVHDFVSNGTGEGAEINVDVGSPASGEARVVVVRLN